MAMSGLTAVTLLLVQQATGLGDPVMVYMNKVWSIDNPIEKPSLAPLRGLLGLREPRSGGPRPCS